MFGGGIPDTNTFFSTVAVLDTHTWTWSYPTLQVSLPCISCECLPALQTQKAVPDAPVCFAGAASMARRVFWQESE